MGEINHIVLTGGPCAGKTTALAILSEWLGGMGIRVVVVPEVATLIHGCGIPIGEVAGRNPLELQTSIIKATMELEEAVRRIVEVSGWERTVIISDRGTMDSKTYTSEADWRTLLSRLGDGVDDHILRDHRYDAVFHLVTAADGAAEFYTTENNGARIETVDEAVAVDKRGQLSWLGHPHLRVIPNVQGGFQGKIDALKRGLARFIGIPEPIENERRFLVGRIDPTAIPVKTVSQDIEQVYLADGSRLRRRDGIITATKKTPRTDGGAGVVERERRISRREYEQLLAFKAGDKGVIRKRRTMFMWEGICMELDSFLNEELGGLQILEVEIDDDEASVSIPDFIPVVKEITGDSSYANASLARRLGSDSK